jgi:hypothetical protein
MNRKQRRRIFKARLKIPATQLIDHKQLFGEQTLEEILEERRTMLQDILQRTPPEKQQEVQLLWKHGDDKIRRLFRGNIRPSDLEGLMQVRLRPPRD